MPQILHDERLRSDFDNSIHMIVFIRQRLLRTGAEDHWQIRPQLPASVSQTIRRHISTVVIGGELEGNIDAAARVELLQTGVLNGDLKAGSLTVAAGSRMRGRAEFGWDEKGGKHT